MFNFKAEFKHPTTNEVYRYEADKGLCLIVTDKATKGFIAGSFSIEGLYALKNDINQIIDESIAEIVRQQKNSPV